MDGMRERLLAADEPLYRVVLSASGGPAAERQIRRVIERKRGDLRRFYRDAERHAPRVHLHLGARRLDDVLTALEGAGFGVDAVIAGTGASEESHRPAAPERQRYVTPGRSNPHP
jgi:hypothetical protein